MTVTNFAPNFREPALSTQEPEMTIEQRAQSLFLVEKIPYKLFGENLQFQERVFKHRATSGEGYYPGGSSVLSGHFAGARSSAHRFNKSAALSMNSPSA